PVLDKEINRLPSRYGRAIILCYLQGLTHDEAARQLGCRKGTLAVWLLRARERLRKGLGRRGISLSVAGLGLALAEQAPAAEATPRGGSLIALDSTRTTPPSVVSLAEGVLRTMFLAKVKVVAAATMLAIALVSLFVQRTTAPVVSASPSVIAEQTEKAEPAKEK